MGLSAQASRAFNAAVISALMLGLGYEALHAVTHPPQPHTDKHERIEHKMSRLREAEISRGLPKANAMSNGVKPPALTLPHWAQA